MSNIVAFSDSHGRLPMTDRFLTVLDEADYIFFLGDGGKDIDFLNGAYRSKLHYVHGNCDFRSGRREEFVETDGVKFFLTHGHRWNETHLPPLPSGAVLAHGHTHIPELKRLDSGTVIFNPGSLSLPKRGLPASYGTFEDGLLRIIELESGREMSALNL